MKSFSYGMCQSSGHVVVRKWTLILPFDEKCCVDRPSSVVNDHAALSSRQPTTKKRSSIGLLADVPTDVLDGMFLFRTANSWFLASLYLLCSTPNRPLDAGDKHQSLSITISNNNALFSGPTSYTGLFLFARQNQ